MRKPNLLASLLFLALCVSLVTPCEAFGLQPVSADEEFEIGITGMTDKKECVKKVTNALSGIKGVSGVSVDFKSKTATLKAPATFDRKSAEKALKAAGYGVDRFEKILPPKSYVLQIKNIKNVGDAKIVRTALAAIDGVDSVVVDHATGKASVTMKKKKELSKKQVEKALKEPFVLESIKES